MTRSALSGGRLRTFAIGFSILLLGGCATAADIIRQAGGGFHVGETRTYSNGSVQTLAASFNGWTIWEISTTNSVACFAIKAGGGRLSPVPHPVLHIVSGVGGGIAIRSGANGLGASARLYGSETWFREGEIEIAGTVYTKTPFLTVLGWEGRSGYYRVVTAASSARNSDNLSETGVLDFTGVTRAWSALQACGVVATG